MCFGEEVVFLSTSNCRCPKSPGFFQKLLSPLPPVVLWLIRKSATNNFMRILIVDDERNIRRTMMLALESMGHESMAVQTGALAIRELKATPTMWSFSI